MCAAFEKPDEAVRRPSFAQSANLAKFGPFGPTFLINYVINYAQIYNIELFEMLNVVSAIFVYTMTRIHPLTLAY